MNIVTGAFGYIGRYIAAELLRSGQSIRTVTTYPNKPNPFGEAVQAFRYNFDQPETLISTLQGARTLYNTYWIRFELDGMTFDQAVANTKILFECAREAGIERIVHISVTNPSPDDILPYYKGKAEQEALLETCGVPYSIVRPTLVFGREDILVNNMAWLIRTFPVFPIFGDGAYRVQPVSVEDVARIAVAAADETSGTLLDAIGQDTYTFEDFIRSLARVLKPGQRFMHVSSSTGIALSRLFSILLRDVVLTREELEGLMAEKLISDQTPNGKIRFEEWLSENRSIVGQKYSSELKRHFYWRPEPHS